MCGRPETLQTGGSLSHAEIINHCLGFAFLWGKFIQKTKAVCYEQCVYPPTLYPPTFINYNLKKYSPAKKVSDLARSYNSITNSIPQMSSKLTIDDLHLIATELLPARNLWEEIGRALGLKDADIQGINGTNPQRALTKMLSTVLQRKSLTWGKLIDALRDAFVLQDALANEIAKKYGEFSKMLPHVSF